MTIDLTIVSSPSPPSSPPNSPPYSQIIRWILLIDFYMSIGCSSSMNNDCSSSINNEFSSRTTISSSTKFSLKEDVIEEPEMVHESFISMSSYDSTKPRLTNEDAEDENGTDVLTEHVSFSVDVANSGPYTYEVNTPSDEKNYASLNTSQREECLTHSASAKSHSQLPRNHHSHQNHRKSKRSKSRSPSRRKEPSSRHMRDHLERSRSRSPRRREYHRRSRSPRSPLTPQSPHHHNDKIQSFGRLINVVHLKEVPGGRATLGRIINVIGESIDHRGDISKSLLCHGGVLLSLRLIERPLIFS
ncbi:hypothetical protein Tco_1466623 [Tanacetum coccineum]